MVLKIESLQAPMIGPLSSWYQLGIDFTDDYEMETEPVTYRRWKALLDGLEGDHFVLLQKIGKAILIKGIGDSEKLAHKVDKSLGNLTDNSTTIHLGSEIYLVRLRKDIPDDLGDLGEDSPLLGLSLYDAMVYNLLVGLEKEDSVILDVPEPIQVVGLRRKLREMQRQEVQSGRGFSVWVQGDEWLDHDRTGSHRYHVSERLDRDIQKVNDDCQHVYDPSGYYRGRGSRPPVLIGHWPVISETTETQRQSSRFERKALMQLAQKRAFQNGAKRALTVVGR